MDKLTTRQILTSLLVGVLSLYSLSLLWDNHVLAQKNRDLVRESQALLKTLESTQISQRKLLLSLQGGEKEKKNMKDTLESLRKQNETLMFQLKKNETQTNSVKEEKSYLEEMLINKTKQIDILKNQKSEQTSAVSEEATEDIQRSIQGNDEELRKLNEQNKTLQDKLDRLYKTTSEKISEINVAKIALAETVSTAQQKIQDEWNTVNLGSVTTSAMAPAHQNDIEETPVPHAPKTEGHVLAINNEHGFVVIDMGKVDNLSPDATLDVKKDGESIATLTVLETRDVMAACNIKNLQEGQQIEINDVVSILR